MKSFEKLYNRMQGLVKATNRYPLTMVFLVTTAVSNAIAINNPNEDYSKYLFTFIVGALLSAVGQQIYERFFIKVMERFLLMGGAVLLSAVYYYIIHSASVFSIENGIKTAVIMFALVIAFVWIPSIKRKLVFNESFMATFKALFITLLFTAVIAGGVSAIIFAIDELLVSLDNRTTAHALNIVFSLFAPIFFLSFTPPYLGKKDIALSEEELIGREEKIKKAISCPKNLAILISYIIIPLTAVYTIILLLYVILNIRGDFWTENLLEPMLVSYAIIVIIVYILASTIENKFSHLFRKIFPKVLLPIVLFQTIASILKINEMGITHGRYYVILFGIFAIIAGLIFSFMSVKKNGVIAPVLIVLSIISIVPPIDAFTVSRTNQIQLLKNTLIDNNMFANGTIAPNSEISVEDKIIITKTVSYIESMNYSEKIDWLPDNIYYNGKFKKTFGFEEVYDERNRMNENKYAYLEWQLSPVMDVEGYDRMLHMNINTMDSKTVSEQEVQFEKDGINYTVKQQYEGDKIIIRVVDHQNHELLRVDTRDVLNNIFDKVQDSYEGKGNGLTVENATFKEENETVKMTILVNSADSNDSQYSADIYIFLKIK